MAGFFESVVSGRGKEALRAAWIIEGKGAGAKALFDSRGTVFRDGDFPAETAETIRTMRTRTGTAEINGSRVFLEGITGGKKLTVCGGGHVSQALIRVCVFLSYQVTVMEDRKEYAEKARAAGAQQVICKPFGEALEEAGEDPSAAYVIMTREHAHDMECLRGILRKPYAYAGMMGSRSRAEQVRRQLLEEGYDPRAVEQLHMPIGLPIGSRTPEEIAVSVAAELIRTLNAQDSGEGFPPGMAEELAEKPGGILAMIVEKNGEAPRRPGTKMWVRSDGSFVGTIGGGTAEAAILQTARKMLAAGERESRLVRITMEKGSMHCGGDITVFLTGI